jgi:uncharacterized membrane protein
MPDNIESVNEKLNSPESQCLMSPSECSYKTDLMSTDSSMKGTVAVASKALEGLALFQSILDVFQEDNISPLVRDLLCLMKDSIQDLNDRITVLEMQASRRVISSSRMNWRDRLVMAEFRITENRGRMLQKDLQRNLGISSRTTMSHLVDQLTSSGRYRKHKEGRNNIIERIA